MNKTENSAGGPDSSLAHSADTQGVNDETNIANKNSTDATGDIEETLTKIREEEEKKAKEKLAKKLEEPIEFKYALLCQDCEMMWINLALLGIMIYIMYSTVSQEPDEGFENVTIMIMACTSLFTGSFGIMLCFISSLACCFSCSWIMFKCTMPKSKGDAAPGGPAAPEGQGTAATNNNEPTKAAGSDMVTTQTAPPAASSQADATGAANAAAGMAQKAISSGKIPGKDAMGDLAKNLPKISGSK